MGRKRGVHIVRVKKLPEFAELFIIKFTRSKCRYARVRIGVATGATDELDAAIKFKRRNK